MTLDEYQLLIGKRSLQSLYFKILKDCAPHC